jgi:protein-disulfide isomerase
VTLTVYEDFACPACRTFHEQFVPVIDRDYVDPGIVTYEFRDFPLEMHAPRSFEAASAARAVQAAGGDEAFFSYVDSLFANQNSLSPDTYAQLASDVEADGEVVRAAAVGRIYRNTIDRDLSMGRDAGVRGTPTVFVDGEQPAELSVTAIAAAIERARSGDA